MKFAGMGRLRNFFRSEKGRETIKDISWEVAGSFLIAIAMRNFALKSEFPMTGFTGISMILYRLFHLPIGLTTIILNIPVIMICYKMIGKEFLMKSFRCMLISSFMIDCVAIYLPLYEGSRMLSALVTGVLGGIGYAVIYSRKSSTGGSDFLIMSAKAMKPHLKLGTITFLSDVGIVVAGGIIFHDVDGIIYGLMITFIFSIAVDKVMYSINSNKLALVVTSQGEVICDVIDQCSGRGSTILDGRGGFRKDKKQVVMVAANSKQMYDIEKTVKTTDEDSFMIIMNSNEVHGEGFRVI